MRLKWKRQSTLGKVLAEKLGFYFIDNENLFFPKTVSDYNRVLLRSYKEAEKSLMNEIRTHENFVFAAVKGVQEKKFCIFIIMQC